jgi:streptogrisin D
VIAGFVVGCAIAAATTGVAGHVEAANPTRTSATALEKYDPGMLEAVARMDSTTREQAAARLDQEAAAYEAVKALQATTSDVDGFFMNAEAQMIVNVTSASTAEHARSLGLIPRVPDRGEAKLRALAESVAQQIHSTNLAGFRGVSIDLSGERVVVDLASPSAATDGESLSRTPGVSVSISTEAVRPKATAIGGNWMWSYEGGSDTWGESCTQGFSGTRPGGVKVILTAGHCIEHDRYTYTNNSPSTATYLGQRIGVAYQTGATYFYPTLDVGLIQLTSPPSYYTSINIRYPGYPTWLAMASVATPWAGQTACKSGVKTGYTCGRVVAPWSYVVYDQGGPDQTYVRELWESTICSLRGDSSGPVFSGNYAVGLVSGGASGSCPYNDGPTYPQGTFFTPVNVVLSSYPGTTTSF